MPKPIPPLDKQYAGRSSDVMSVNHSMSREAVRLLRQYAPGSKSQGKFLSELVFDYDRCQGFGNLVQEVRKELRKVLRDVRRENSDPK